MNKLHNLLQLIEDASISDRQFEDKLGFKHSAIYSWRNGRAEPKLDDLFILSDYFEVSIDYLLGREKQATINISANKKVLNEKFDQLSDDNQQRAIGRIEEILSNQQEADQTKTKCRIININRELCRK